MFHIGGNNSRNNSGATNGSGSGTGSASGSGSNYVKRQNTVTGGDGGGGGVKSYVIPPSSSSSSRPSTASAAVKPSTFSPGGHSSADARQYPRLLSFLLFCWFLRLFLVLILQGSLLPKPEVLPSPTQCPVRPEA